MFDVCHNSNIEIRCQQAYFLLNSLCALAFCIRILFENWQLKIENFPANKREVPAPIVQWTERETPKL